MVSVLLLKVVRLESVVRGEIDEDRTVTIAENVSSGVTLIVDADSVVDVEVGPLQTSEILSV